ncbi:putative phosphatase regulatory subunit-domain-containing protein [Phaeosphaeriaceae sp. PMI808]|nr:putative phosphatase regulatory subunit-domain-containing protein [Phaeosphaeriaceae sp. PMI808]
MSHLKLVRKKSGEAVKSSLRPSTSFSTSAKAVHFSEDLEQSRHFLQSKCTASISADSSPTDEAQNYTLTLPAPSKISPCQYTRWEATSYNIHRGSRGRDFVQLHDFGLSSDRQSLIGAVAVANIAFEKRVSARFTTDDWQTVSEVTAEFERPKGTYDRFSFTIALPAEAEAQAMTVIVCLRYQVNGQEFWNNNSGKNYFINLALERPLPSNEVSNHRHPSRGHPESRLSERYSFTASVADELARCVSDSKIRVLLGSSPTWINQGRSELNFGSTAYMDMIENLCYFKPPDRLSDVSQLIHRSSVDERFQSSHIIHCF